MEDSGNNSNIMIKLTTINYSILKVVNGGFFIIIKNTLLGDECNR